MSEEDLIKQAYEEFIKNLFRNFYDNLYDVEQFDPRESGRASLSKRS